MRNHSHTKDVFFTRLKWRDAIQIKERNISLNQKKLSKRTPHTSAIPYLTNLVHSQCLWIIGLSNLKSSKNCITLSPVEQNHRPRRDQIRSPSKKFSAFIVNNRFFILYFLFWSMSMSMRFIDQATSQFLTTLFLNMSCVLFSLAASDNMWWGQRSEELFALTLS